MSMATATPTRTHPACAIAPEALPERRAIVRAAAGIAVYAGAFGFTFGAVATAAGLERRCRPWC